MRDRLVVPMPADRLQGWLATIAVALIAGVWRFWHVNRPRGIIFDETYYTVDARDLLQNGVEHNRGYLFTVHPPLGKWMIAFSEWIFGFEDANGVRQGSPELGWRVASAVAGTVAVLLLARAARRMFRSTLLGCVAGLLLALDGLEFVLSRTGILDIFLMAWIVAALACLVVDRDDGRRRLADRLDAGPDPGDGPGPWVLVRPWRLAAGACLGAACATKWSGLYDIGAFLVLAYLWDVGARRTAGIRRPWLAALRRDSPILAVGFIVAPIVVYTASWTGWFLSPDGYDRHAKGSGIFGTLHSWIFYQSEQLDFHRHLTAGHPYRSSPFSWLVLGRPISFYYQSVPYGQTGCKSQNGCASEVLALGTPAIWWVGLVALAACLVLWIGRRDWRAGLVVIGFLFSWVPWVAQPGRTMFLFYALPLLPFLVLGLTTVAQLVLGPREASERRRTVGGIAVGAYLLIVVANFVFLYPILAAEVIPLSSWQDRMWFPGWI